MESGRRDGRHPFRRGSGIRIDARSQADKSGCKRREIEEDASPGNAFALTDRYLVSFGAAKELQSSSEKMPFRPMIGSEKSIFEGLVLEEVERSIINLMMLCPFQMTLIP
jgi:hypothetical protein